MYIPSTYFRMAHLWVREEVQKKNGKFVPFFDKPGGGGSKKEKRQTSILEKYFFREHVKSF